MPDTPQSSRPPGPAPAEVSPQGAGERAEHTADRWARWETARGRGNAAAKRRLLFIAGVVALGIIIWLIWTH